MLSHLRRWSQHMLARLPAAIPCSCAVCGADSESAMCNGCRAQFFANRRHRCSCCAIPLADEAAAVCGACLKHPPAFDATVAAADYAAPVDQLVLALKFGNRLALAPLLAHLLHDTCREASPGDEPTHLTAVPLGPRRLVERGFNQALEIARPLSRSLGARLDARIIVRQRDTHAQALLHPDERHRNIRGAFVVPAAAIDRLRGAHVGVVDDVMTTGETLNEIASTLKRFGARRVTNLVFARTAPQ